VCGERAERQQARGLREAEDRKPRQHALPGDGRERGGPQREIKADLECWQERDRTLRIGKRRSCA
jgi:hypothetical protein